MGICSPVAVLRSLTDLNLSGNNEEKLTQKTDANVSNKHVVKINQANNNQASLTGSKEGGVNIRI